MCFNQQVQLNFWKVSAGQVGMNPRDRERDRFWLLGQGQLSN